MAPGANVFTEGIKLIPAIARGFHAKEEAVKACDAAVRIAGKLGLSQGVLDNLNYLGDRWDGKQSMRGVRGQFIPVGARIVNFAEAAQILHATDGAQEAQELALQRRGKAFDPQVVDAFLELSKDASFAEALEQDSLLDSVWAMEPPNPYSYTTESRLDNIAAAFAEFIDMKSPFTATHSSGVALVAERLAKKIGLPEQEVTMVRRAGLLHDFGKISVSNTILNKKGKLNEQEWELMRLHPYYTERILSKVEALRPLASIAGAHHEWMDGNGYFRQIKGPEMSKAAHIIAGADMFQALSEERPYRPALETEQVLRIMEEEAGSHLCRDCFDSLKTVL